MYKAARRSLRELLPKPSPAYGSRFKNNYRHESANIKNESVIRESQGRSVGDLRQQPPAPRKQNETMHW
jgi:hypothetical protein